jgi:hypothetical protein
MKRSILLAAALMGGLSSAAPTLHGRQYGNSTCRQTKVAIM